MFMNMVSGCKNSHAKLCTKVENEHQMTSFLKDQILCGMAELATKSDVATVSEKVDAADTKL